MSNYASPNYGVNPYTVDACWSSFIKLQWLFCYCIGRNWADIQRSTHTQSSIRRRNKGTKSPLDKVGSRVLLETICSFASSAEEPPAATCVTKVAIGATIFLGLAFIAASTVIPLYLVPVLTVTTSTSLVFVLRSAFHFPVTGNHAPHLSPFLIRCPTDDRFTNMFSIYEQ
jgi:hypothetical protein